MLNSFYDRGRAFKTTFQGKDLCVHDKERYRNAREDITVVSRSKSSQASDITETEICQELQRLTTCSRHQGRSNLNDLGCRKSRHRNVVFPKTPLSFVWVLKRIMSLGFIEALPKSLLDLDDRQVTRSLAGQRLRRQVLFSKQRSILSSAIQRQFSSWSTPTTIVLLVLMGSRSLNRSLNIAKCRRIISVYFTNSSTQSTSQPRLEQALNRLPPSLASLDVKSV